MSNCKIQIIEKKFEKFINFLNLYLTHLSQRIYKFRIESALF
jgi:hypothetical protein